MKKTLAIGACLIILVIAGLGFYISSALHSSDINNNEVIFVVEQGQSFKALAEDLQGLHVVKNAMLFTIYAKIMGQTEKVKVGEYALHTGMAASDVLKVITSGKSIAKPFTVAEGLNLFEVSDLFEEEGFGKSKDFMALCHNQEFIQSLLGEKHDSLEGYLYPETYMLTRFDNARTLITAMVKRFLVVYNSIAKNYKLNLSRHEIVTFASLIEKETGAPDERPKIASVFYNRLNKGMLLQTDPTIIYGEALESGKMDLKITRAAIHRSTPYNTYVIKGLPPGPIANPGKDSLIAVFIPEKTNYFYFVSHNNGTHEFSENYETHSKAVQKYQLTPQPKYGKPSPTKSKSDSKVKSPQI